MDATTATITVDCSARGNGITKKGAGVAGANVWLSGVDSAGGTMVDPDGVPCEGGDVPCVGDGVPCVGDGDAGAGVAGNVVSGAGVAGAGVACTDAMRKLSKNGYAPNAHNGETS